MKRQDINIRDPYVLVHEGCYYLYGTRSDTAWSRADGFDCYVSRDLSDLTDPLRFFTARMVFLQTGISGLPSVMCMMERSTS